MRWTTPGAWAAALPLALLLGIGAGPDPAPTRGVDPHGEASAASRADGASEVDRIQGHLARAAASMRSDEPDDLTDEQREARRATLAWLDEYRSRAVFPHNHVRPGERTPVFVDPHGTPCAVGYLMLRSGEHALVEEIVRADNLAHVPELADDPRVARWLRARGITLEEAAMIQPQYGGQPPGPSVREASNYAGATVGASIATAAVAAYAAVVGPDEGAPLVDALLFGTTIGHGYLLLETREGAVDADWATALNAAGLFVSVGLELTRVLGRGDESRAEEAAFLAPHVAPGPFGTELGLSLHH